MITSADLLRFCIERKASDLHISAGEPPMVRISGDLVRVVPAGYGSAPWAGSPSSARSPH